MKLLYLDIDGVLNDHSRLPNGYSRIMDAQVVCLNTVLKYTDAKIVLSSAWRCLFRTAELVEGLLLCHGVNCHQRVYGTTAIDPEIWSLLHERHADLHYWAERGMTWRADQIRDHVREHRPYRYVVLDDLPIQVDNLVQTIPSVGLTALQAEEIVRRLDT